MSTTYSTLTTPLTGSTGTGLDQLPQLIQADNSLLGNNSAANILAGVAAADQLNRLIVEAATATGSGVGGVFTTANVIAMNAYIRANRLAEWTLAHGDDDGTVETGFHLVQNDGANTNYQGQNLVNTVIDGIYHLGFAIQGANFLNEDGNANATVQQVASWLTQFYTDHSTTNTGLDRIVDLIQADAGLGAKISNSQLAAGQDAANGLNQLIADGIAATGVATDGWINTSDVQAVSTWIRSDATRLSRFVALHGDDNGATETGYHLVQNDGSNTTWFGKNLVNTVVDGLYHIGFEIRGNNFLNEDGNANAVVSDVASWLNYFYTDQSTTGTGLDRIVDIIKTDAGLARNTSAADINAGATYANALNQLVVDAINATGAMADSWITSQDLRAMSAWVRSDTGRLQNFLNLHGDDNGTTETGYHLVQNDGGNTTWFGKNLINTVADGIYHFGFQIQGNNFLNEDGNTNAALSDVATWLNYAYKSAAWIDGDGTNETLVGTDAAEQITARSGNDTVNAGAGDDAIWGGSGNDVLSGGAGQDLLYGEQGDDTLDGGADSDIYRVSGNTAANGGFEGYDTYNDTGTTGSDRLEAISGANTDVDIGLTGWGNNGVETIDATGATGTVRLLGNGNANTLDFRATTLTGNNLVIDGGGGNDTIFGNAADNVIVGGSGDDTVDGGSGSDTYRVTGNTAASFTGYDTYADTGTTGADKIVALGTGDVDIGVTNWNGTGIETIDATGAAGTVRILGSGNANTLDFRTTTLTGANLVIDGGGGNDTIFGNAVDNVIVSGSGDDTVDGGNGSDTYRVTGNTAASFSGYDTYTDTGTTGTDKIVALGTGDVDIGVTNWNGTGVETIDATGAKGAVRLLGNGNANTLDLRTTTLTGANLVIDGGGGNDTIFGNAADNVIVGGSGDDTVDGGSGSDTYRVTGNTAASFTGYDTYKDTGTTGTDKIVALGTGDVDIGVTNWNGTGVETIDATGAKGAVRLLGNGNANTLDLRTTTLTGANLVIDGGGGNDTIFGNAVDNVIVSGSGDDTVDGGNGSDTYRVTGNTAASFSGYDTYTDTGTTGADKIVALGTGDVDIGVTNWNGTGVETIDATGATGAVRLLGNGNANTLDFRTTTLTGANLVIDGGSGNDTIFGNTTNNIVVGGLGDDTLDGRDGGDTYRVTGNQAGGWSSFNGYDTYTDTGATGTDKLVALGVGDVDIGLTGWGSTTGVEAIDATSASGTVRLLGNGNANTLDFRVTTLTGTNLVIDGGSGNDTIFGNAVANTLVGGLGDDTLDGGDGGDTYRVTGNQAGGWSSFNGYDTYTDTGATGPDKLVALGVGDVDIGLTGWGSTTGVETIDATGATGTVRLLGNGNANTLDFRTTTLTGANLVIDGGSGNDTIFGNTTNNIVVGGLGDDTLDGGDGADTYRVTGNQAGGWSSFNGYDTYTDTGATGTDKLVALGVGDVDIGLTGWGSTTGVEAIDATSASGTVRLLGNGNANTLDFRATTLTGTNLVIDGGSGNDTLFGNATANTLVGSLGDDTLDGGDGGDTYRVTGNQAGGWSSFNGYDTYKDAGATGADKLVALGVGDVDIGLTGWGSTTGVETIDATGATGAVRLLGDGNANTLDFRATTLTGNNITIDGGYGNDTIFGNAGANVIAGSYGNDTLDGGTGNDTYLIGRGKGTDRITDTDTQAGNTDVVRFEAGVTADQLWFRKVGNDLSVAVIGTGDGVTVSNWYSGSASHIEQFRTADGKVLLDSNVDKLVSAMATLSAPSWGVTTLSSSYQTALGGVLAANWTTGT